MTENSRKIYRKRGRCKVFFNKKAVAFTVIVSLMCSACTAFAADGNVLNNAGLAGPMGTFFRFAKIIAIPIAVLGVAMCGFSFFISNDKGRERLKKTLMNIGIALVGLMIIPLIISFGLNTMQDKGWKAGADDNPVIVQPADGTGPVDMSVGPTQTETPE